MIPPSIDNIFIIRENTKDLFDIEDDIEVLNRAIYCLEQDIFYDCYD